MPTACPITDDSLSTDLPVLLLPVRLETRRIADDLCIRVFPDQPFVDAHQHELTAQELAAGQELKRLVRAGDLGEAARGEWRELARRYGSNRASWVLETLLRDQGVPPADPQPVFTPRLFLLPQRFLFFVYIRDVLAYCEAGQRIRRHLLLLPEPSDEIANAPPADGLFDRASRWIADFDAALAAGLAIRIPLWPEHAASEKLLFSRIVVVGLQEGTALDEAGPIEQLVQTHRHSDGFEFLPYATPTNNTANATSGHSDSEEELLGSFDYEVRSPVDELTPERVSVSAYAQLSRALGLPSESRLLAHIKGSDIEHGQPLPQMIEALWPSTGDYFLRTMLSYDKLMGDGRTLMQHAARYLRPRGPLATIRIGKQPYGILPVTRIRSQGADAGAWRASERDHGEETELDDWIAFDNRLHAALSALLPRWLERAGNTSAVPRLRGGGDLDEEILQVMSMLPHSVEYRSRPIVDQTLVMVLLWMLGGTLFGARSSFASLADPQKAISTWIAEKDRMTANTLALLEQMGADGRKDTPLLLAFAWGGGVPLSMALVRDPEHREDGPERYLPHLLQQRAGASTNFSNTLLYDLVRRSYGLASGSPELLAVIDAALRGIGDPVVDYCNRPLSPASLEVLASRAPKIEPFPHEDALRDSVDRLKELREAAPNGRFATVQEAELAFASAPELWSNITQKLRDEHDRLLEMALRDLIDALTYRLDAWYTSLASSRLQAMRERSPIGCHCGAFGYLEDIDLSPATTRAAAQGGFIHAPSVAHASAAAILRSGHQSHRYDEGGNPYALNLSSSRVDRALMLLEGVREGQSLSALLGYQFERTLHDAGLDRVIAPFRQSFPIAKPDEEADAAPESTAPRDVCDGRAVVAAHLEGNAAIDAVRGTLGSDASKLNNVLAELADAADAVGDVLLVEGVHQAVQGNFERSGAALDASAGNGQPPELDSTVTPSAGLTLRHRVCLFLRATSLGDSPQARAQAEPRLNAWLADVFGELSDIGCRAYIVGDGSESDPIDIALSALEPAIAPLDLLYMCAPSPTGTGTSEIELRIRRHVRSLNGVDPAARIRIALDETTTPFAVADAMELGRATLGMLGSATPLTASCMTHPDQTPEPPVQSELAVADLVRRAQSTWELLNGHISGLESADPEALDGCAEFGIEEALLDADNATALATRFKRTLAPAKKRLNAAASFIEGALTSSTSSRATDGRVASATNALRALFGSAFIVLPTVDAMALGADRIASFSSVMPGRPSEDRVWLWLQQVAATHPRVRRFEAFLLAAQAWGTMAGRAESGLQVAQLTAGAKHDNSAYPWQALSDDEIAGLGGRVGGAQSIVAMTFGSFDPAHMTGLVVDEWTETLAASEAISGISFEYNQPASQAPQCFLLAVPGNFDEAAWTGEHLAGIVCDTMDLAKARLVDLDALPAVAGVFPSLMVPIGSRLPPLGPIGGLRVQ